MESTKKHEALFHLIESSKQTMTDREKQKVTYCGQLDAWGLVTDALPDLSYEYKGTG